MVSNAISFEEIYPFLAEFNSGSTYIRTRKGKREIVRKGRKRVTNIEQTVNKGAKILGATGLGTYAGLTGLGYEFKREVARGKKGILYSLKRSPYGKAKVLAIPAAIGIASGVAAYKYVNRKRKK